MTISTSLMGRFQFKMPSKKGTEMHFGSGKTHEEVSMNAERIKRIAENTARGLQNDFLDLAKSKRGESLAKDLKVKSSETEAERIKRIAEKTAKELNKRR